MFFQLEKFKMEDFNSQKSTSNMLAGELWVLRSVHLKFTKFEKYCLKLNMFTPEIIQ